MASLEPAFKTTGPVDTWCPLSLKNRPAGDIRLIMHFRSAEAPKQDTAAMINMAKYGAPAWGSQSCAGATGPAAQAVAPPVSGAVPPPPPTTLPPGWQALKDPSGKPYYVNTATGATQWHLPHSTSGASHPQNYSQNPAPTPVMNPPPPPAYTLPEGWRKLVDPNGKPYYVNDITRETRWDPPPAPLPPFWEELCDAQGKTYYVDHLNQRTQWERPC